MEPCGTCGVLAGYHMRSCPHRVINGELIRYHADSRALELALLRILDARRKSFSMDYAEIARRLEMPGRVVAKIFRGERRMSIDHFTTLCFVVQLNPAEVFARGMYAI